MLVRCALTVRSVMPRSRAARRTALTPAASSTTGQYRFNTGWLAPGALLVWEEAAAVLPPPGLTLLDARRYGDTMITLMRVSA